MKRFIKLSLRKTSNKFVSLQIMLLVFTLGCEESLPTRDQEFIKVFETKFSTIDGKTTLTFQRDLTTAFPSPPDLKISLRFINISDETLQGFADSIDGFLDIWLRDEPSVGRRFPINKDSELPPTGAPSRIDGLYLTLDPGDTFYMEFHWAHDSEEGVKMWDHFNLSHEEQKRVNVRVLAKLKLFPDTPLIITPTLHLEVTYFKFE